MPIEQERNRLPAETQNKCRARPCRPPLSFASKRIEPKRLHHMNVMKSFQQGHCTVLNLPNLPSARAGRPRKRESPKLAFLVASSVQILPQAVGELCSVEAAT